MNVNKIIDFIDVSEYIHGTMQVNIYTRTAYPIYFCSSNTLP